MNKYTELSDFEINVKVANLTLVAGSYGLCHRSRIVKRYVTDDKGLCMTFDPCNNPTDAMPIIIENEISMIKSSGGWMCCHGSVGQVEHESLYRGAMEVFLMIKDKGNKDD